MQSEVYHVTRIPPDNLLDTVQGADPCHKCCSVMQEKESITEEENSSLCYVALERSVKLDAHLLGKANLAEAGLEIPREHPSCSLQTSKARGEQGSTKGVGPGREVLEGLHPHQLAGAGPVRALTHAANQHEAGPWKTCPPSLQNCHHPATHQGVVLHEVLYLHHQGPRRRLAWRQLAPHKPTRPYQREEMRDQPQKKKDQWEPANHLIPEPHWGAGLHAISFHRDLKTPWKHLTQRESAPHSTAGATLGSGAALKLTPPKPEKSTENPETVGDWIPLPPRARIGRGATHMLTPPSPEYSVEGPGTAGEDTPLATSSGAECRTAHKLIPLTANSGAGLGTVGACPPHSHPELNQGDKPVGLRGLRSWLLPARTLLTGTARRLGPLLLLSRTLISILHMCLEKGEVETLTTPVFG
ncbi:hypothetical protein E2C01_035481 [Portunus trituberculatus]|uniref:Uncharacterized protein n=1 Tax=Portunus trituberculatus TaxID=210409 RepID=A0A5B7F9W1_PORTR|nr:hypothetical protein [Portunus trituberculatus]